MRNIILKNTFGLCAKQQLMIIFVMLHNVPKEWNLPALSRVQMLLKHNKHYGYIECSERKRKYKPVSPGTHHPIIKTKWQRSPNHDIVILYNVKENASSSDQSCIRTVSSILASTFKTWLGFWSQKPIHMLELCKV